MTPGLGFAATLRPLDAPGWAQERTGAGSIDYASRVIARRQFSLEHELFLAAEILPSDALYKGFCVHLAYARHFNELWAWEAASLTYCGTLDTDLKSQLLPIAARANQTLPILPEVMGAFGTRLQLKPFYGKQAWRNAGLVHGELFVAAGPALVTMRIRNAQTRLAPGFDFGLGVRAWLNHKFSVRADVADLVVFVAGKTTQVLRVDIGFGIELGGGL